MRNRTLHYLSPLVFTMLIGPSALYAQSHREEVTFITDNQRLPDRDRQLELRQWAGWPAFKQLHPRWTAEFNEYTGLPRRAYGDPIPVAGASPAERAIAFLSEELAAYRLPLEQLVLRAASTGGKVTYVHLEQVHEGLPVLGAKAMVKFDQQGRVIAFSTDLLKDITVPLVPAVGPATAITSASEGLFNIVSQEVDDLAIVGVPQNGRLVPHLVHRVRVDTQRGDTPGRFECLVDAQDGTLLYRTNIVRNCGGDHGEGDAGVDVSVTTLAYTGSPLVAPEVQPMPDMDVTINGTLLRTDASGFLPSGIPGPASGFFQLRGRWANVSTNSTTPTFTVPLNEGYNEVVFNTPANIRERSAYLYVNQIHAHMKNVLPDFTGMDFQMPTRLDLTTDNCNAFYDGSSINFYAEGNNCRSLATINDVVYHEYGHGINDKFYTSLSSSFVNGAMNEGYADVWGLTLTQSPVLGLGMRLDNDNSSVRRYDVDPKVYPINIVGEVHADGEIIAGAWWDLYELLGFDMELTLDLFAAAYPGLQANTFNGNEGEAFRDVLLDVLQADDNDDDITNGTPHGAAIVEAFGIHGITLISGAELLHNGLLLAPAEQTIELASLLSIMFPATLYLQDASLFYKVNDQVDWTTTVMTSPNEGSYVANIPPQPAGTLVSYYVGLRDIFGQTSSVNPIASDKPDPGLPNYVLVGYALAATENADNLSELGAWQEGQPGDNATTGIWEFGSPVGSYGTPGVPSTVCQPGYQHTDGGANCWYTGNALSTTSAIGENDVDEGSTTLLGPNVDLSNYTQPAMSYWRWYTNNPPSGANPNSDWWQVYASGDNGSTWVSVEDTKTGERNWRRKAFRVADVLGEDATQIRLKFIASDSIRLEQELEGGSLVEAAIDDIEVWSMVGPDAVAEYANERALAVWPSPTQGLLNIEARVPNEPGMQVEVLDFTGRIVVSPRAVPQDLVRLDVSSLADGQYVVRLRSSQGSVERRFSVLH